MPFRDTIVCRVYCVDSMVLWEVTHFCNNFNGKSKKWKCRSITCSNQHAEAILRSYTLNKFFYWHKHKQYGLEWYGRVIAVEKFTLNYLRINDFCSNFCLDRIHSNNPRSSCVYNVHYLLTTQPHIYVRTGNVRLCSTRFPSTIRNCWTGNGYADNQDGHWTARVTSVPIFLRELIHHDSWHGLFTNLVSSYVFICSLICAKNLELAGRWHSLSICLCQCTHKYGAFAFWRHLCNWTTIDRKTNTIVLMCETFLLTRPFHFWYTALEPSFGQ